MYTCISITFYNSTIGILKFKSSVEVYLMEVNPIDAYLISRSVVEVFAVTI